MYAVIKTGGKQYRVKEGDVLAVERIPFEAGHPVDFDQVLLIENEDKILLGTPFIAGAVVRATAVEGFKGDKVIIFKKKRKKQYRRTKGHRQQLVRVRIDEIVPDVSLAPDRKPVKPIEKPVPKPAPVPKPKVEAAPAEVKKGAHKPAPAPKKAEKPAKFAAKHAKAEKPREKKAEKEKKHEAHKHEAHKLAAKHKKTSK
jgi:large subunit ribosomal protein L21